MFEYYETIIMPQNLELERLLGIKRINVQHQGHEEAITVQEKEDGFTIDCNHAGATLKEMDVDTLVFSEVEGNYLPKSHKKTLFVCDKCTAMSDDGAEWYD